MELFYPRHSQLLSTLMIPQKVVFPKRHIMNSGGYRLTNVLFRAFYETLNLPLSLLLCHVVLHPA